MRFASDRVQETTSTTGTGNLTLTGAPATFVTFSSVFQVGERFSYVAFNTTEVEKGVGYLSASTTFVRESVDGGTPTNFTSAPSIFFDLTSRVAVDVGRAIAVASLPRILG